MAIKTVSQLDPFNADTANYGNVAVISSNMAYFENGYLTTNDKQCAAAILANTTTKNYASGANKISLKPMSTNSETFWSSLFEVSQPTIPSKSNPGKQDVYSSYNFRYEDLLKTVLFDVKSYLNYRNRINDYNLSAIVDGNQMFRGNKYLSGGLSVSNNISSYALSAYNGVVSNLTSNNTYDYNLSVHSTMSVDCNISTSTSGLIFDGWSFGLVNRKGTVLSAYGDINLSSLSGDAIPKSWVSCGTYDSTEPKPNYHNLSGHTNRRGDPVCFVNGRPYELTCVNNALHAYNLMNSDGSICNVGTARLLKTLGGYTLGNPEFTVVKFENGKPTACNEIDFAHHALWSDLGERYLADAEYEPGTLVKFGGEKEITIADNEVNAIVSTKAFDLNAQLVGGTVIALCGRVPTKVKGKIQKFDKIMLSDTPGVACKWDGTTQAIGRALESNIDEGIKLVECVTRFEV